MIQKGSCLNVVDNSGGKKVCCMHISGGYRKKYAKIGDVIIVSLKTVKTKRKDNSKIKKGDVVKALVVQTKEKKSSLSGQRISFFNNTVVLLNKQNKFLGTRVFVPVLSMFRSTRFLKLILLAPGLVK